MTMGNAARAFDAEWIGQPYHEDLQSGIRPLRPSDDAFYVAPVGFEHTAPAVTDCDTLLVLAGDPHRRTGRCCRR